LGSSIATRPEYVANSTSEVIASDGSRARFGGGLLGTAPDATAPDAAASVAAGALADAAAASPSGTESDSGMCVDTILLVEFDARHSKTE
jgi:hypothetical protein